MNKHNILKWCEALESGNFKQTQRVLCQIINNEKLFCCLGVGCHVANIPIPMVHTKDDIVLSIPYNLSKNSSIYGLVPIEFIRWLGIENKLVDDEVFLEQKGLECVLQEGTDVIDLKSEYDQYIIYADGMALHQLNDENKQDFKQIASVIRRAAKLPERNQK